MTVASEPHPTDSVEGDLGAEAAVDDHDQVRVCDRCGTPLAHDQEWCLECGTAQAIIRHPPDWRIPLGIVATIVLLVLAAFAIALTNLASEANRSAASVTLTRTVPAAKASTTSSASTAHAATRPPAPVIGYWGRGRPGWTVALASSPTKSGAVKIAQHYLHGGLVVGVLNSSAHPSMTPGEWLVFAGHYPDETAARTAQNRLLARGYNTVSVRLVGTPGAGG